MKLNFPNDVNEFHTLDGACHKADNEHKLSGDFSDRQVNEFLKAGFTHAEEVVEPDTSALTTVDIEGEQKIPQGVDHGSN